MAFDSGRHGIGRRKAAGATRRAAAAAARAAAESAAAAQMLRTDAPGVLVAEGALERTHKLRQPALLDGVDAATRARAAFGLDLAGSGGGPYVACAYSRSGKGMLVAGRKGHVAAMEWRNAGLRCELNLNETVRDVCWLHNDGYFAVAQKKYAYIYDAGGVQLHVLRKCREPGSLAFLPHHFLLVSATSAIANEQRIAYTDTSTGALVMDAAFGARTLNLGVVSDLAVNGLSGVVCGAHGNGVVSLWSPTQPTPLARFFAHPGGVRKVCVSLDGRTIVTAGADATVRAWDARMFHARAAWTLPAVPTAMAMSQRGMVAAGFGATVHVWSGAEDKKGRRAGREMAAMSVGGAGSRPRPRSPYMVQQYPRTPVTGLAFCPFEDLLAVCHADGLASMVVPGAGEAAFDSNAPNPFATKKALRNAEVRALLDKLRPETIALDVSNIGGVDPDPAARLSEMRGRVEAESERGRSKMVEKRRKKGKGKISKQLARKQKNVIDAKRAELLERRDKEREEKRREAAKNVAGSEEVEHVQPALRRFYSKQK